MSAVQDTTGQTGRWRAWKAACADHLRVKIDPPSPGRDDERLRPTGAVYCMAQRMHALNKAG